MHSVELVGTTTPRDEQPNNQTRGGSRYGCWLSFSFPITLNLRILAWNANSVFDKKKAELELFLRTNNIDVAAISETKLHPKRIFTMPGFKVYRSDRNQFGGGVMLLVNNNLRHDSFSLPRLSGLEVTAICLQLQYHNKLLFVSAYLPPAVTIAPTDLDAISSLHDTAVLAGDLNCKHVSWNNASVNKNGSTLLSYSLNKTITINYPNQPTHLPYNSYPCILDIALSQRCTTSKPQSIPALSSDHNPIVFKFHLHPDFSAPTILYDYKHANWPLFQHSLDTTLDPDPPIQTTIELDYTIATFTWSVQWATIHAIPVYTTKCNHLTLPPNLRYLLKLKNYY